MPQASPDSIDHYPAFLARLPPDLDLESLARQHKAFQRSRGVRSGTDLLRLVLAWGPGGYSLQQVAAWAGEQGIAEITDEALIQRLHGTVPFLQAVTSHLLMPMTHAPCWHGRVLRISDSTSLSKQASQGTDWRLHGVYDLACGGFTHLELTDGHAGGRRGSRHRSSHDAVEVDRRVAQVRVVDPHHPLFGCYFPASDRQSGRGPGLIVVRLPDGRERSIPRSATDLAFSVEGSVPSAPRRMHISVRTLLPLANHVRAVLASRHEDVSNGSQLDRTPRSERGGPFRYTNGVAAPVAPASGRDAAATCTADRPATSACAADTSPGSGGTSC